MRRKTPVLVGIILAAILVLSLTATAMLIPANDEAKEHSQATDHSQAIDKTESGNWDLERIDFIHYVRPDVQPKAPKAESCYKLLGVKWKALPVNYVINPTNLEGLKEAFVTAAVSTSAETWDIGTSSELFNDTYTIDSTAQYGVQNFQNAIVFSDYPDERVIAVTSIWYTPKGKQIVEFDMLFNTRFDWGDASLDSTKMDLQNIATHEFGHSVGLGDLYSSTCSEVTMYGYSIEGETKKRTLEEPDRTGLQVLYGA